MNPAMKKNSSSRSGSDIPSPVLLRRRLSAPETVMRKYKLARARSQDSDTDPSSDSKFGELSYDSHSGSEINLQKKRDTAVMMRKSTLLRRLMNNPKAFGSSSFQEWQHYCGKLSTPSLTSLQGSPEHMSKSLSRRSLVGYEYKTSPKHTLGSKKVSPVHQLYETHKKSPVHLASMSPKRRLENHGVSYQIHSTRPKEVPTLSSLRSSVNDLSKSTFAHSDSAYSNDRSNMSLLSASTCTSNNTNLTTQESIRYKRGPLENNPENMDQRNVDENRNFSVNTNVNYVTQETSTQTTSSTNLNVISNVKLSQKTLDMIVNEVMKDVNKGCTNGNDIQDKTAGSIHVRKISGLNEISSGNIERPNENLKYLTDARIQAQGHNSSRISIISSKSSIGDRSDNIEDPSDVASIADSLEDTSSSRLSLRKYDDKPVRGDLPPIPVRGRKKLFNTKPPDAFFVPIKTEAEDVKSVSDYLPEKLREKILRRQKSRQDKVDQFRSNPDLSTMKEKNSNGSKSRPSKKTRFRKPILPSIESFRKKQRDEKMNEPQQQEEKANTKKTKRKSRDNPPPTSRKSKSTGNHHNHFHMFTSENDYLYEGEPKRIYHKAEFRNSNRRIEILEIMECVDLGDKYNKITTKTKSKIPLLKSPKLTKTTTNPVLVKKATYLDFSEVFKADPNLDQLISDILIQSLNNNKDVPVETKTSNSKTENENIEHQEELRVNPNESTQKSSNNNNDYLIPNVTSTNDSGIQVDLNQSDIKSNQVPKVEPDIFNIHKEIRTVQDSKNTQTIPEEWVGSRMPQRKEEPSFINQASNEGRKPGSPKVEMKKGSRKFDEAKEFNSSSEEWRYRSMQEEYEFESSSNDKNDFYKRIILPPPLPRRYGQSSRRPRYREMSNGNPTPGEWSIILSGTNNATLASDLEMKIRFPSARRNSCFPFSTNSESRESRGNTGGLNEGTRFPHKHFNNFDNGNRFYNESNERFRKLPDINNMRVPDNQRVSDPVAALRAMEITDIRPRQTKTSLRRYNMTRPKLHPLFETNVDNSNIESQYTGMLNRVPDILSINGYSVSPDNKYNVPGMSRRNIPRHNCMSNDM